MKCPPALPEELDRLRALAEYGFHEGRPVPSLDPVVRVAARAFAAPVSAVNIIGSDQVFFAASTGTPGAGAVDMRRDVSFCAHAITQDQVMVVPDAARDERFHDNPLVTGPFALRFYAGIPLRSATGHALGALCVIDNKPRDDFSEDDREHLRELARMASDRLELQRLTILAQRNQPRFSTMAGQSPTPVICFDDVGSVVAWNDAAASLHGYAPAEMLGSPMAMLVAPHDRPALQHMLKQMVSGEPLPAAMARLELRGSRKNGEEFMLELAPFRWQEHDQPRFSAILQDVSERHEQARELRRLASVDSLTGLGNRHALRQMLEALLSSGRSAAVVAIGIDHFRDVNNTLGPAVGDELLREVARRLRYVVAADHVLTRIGGDEFAVLLADVADPAPARHLADAAAVSIADPFTVEGHEIRLASSAGIAVGPLHADDALELIANAELALAHAKSGGRRRSFVFVPALRMEAVARRQYDLELHRAVGRGELLLHFQPQFRLGDGALAGAEALVRWQHPQRGLLSPAAFLPALEAGPLAATVGEWILDAACAQAAAWHARGAALRIAVNLFQAQFRVGDLAAMVIAAIERHGLPPQCLELEITENIALNHDDVVLEPLRQLRWHGVGIAFDDFGTGYASLSLLKRYPLTRIKIDRSFVQSMMESRPDGTVVRAILDMARSFGIATTAEGIETPAQHDWLREEGCDEGQGYLFGRAMSEAEFAAAFLDALSEDAAVSPRRSRPSGRPG